MHEKKQREKMQAEKKIVVQYSSTGEMDAKEAVRRIIEAHDTGRYEVPPCTR
ncbi:MAG: hypothetical protein IJY09_09705 [Lachnospiraceae bacterium]|nr:hypothetical protein [Lachnospiraceae bacterium]